MEPAADPSLPHQGPGAAPEGQPPWAPPPSPPVPPASSSSSAPRPWGSFFSAQAAANTGLPGVVSRAEAAPPPDSLAEEMPPKIARGLRKFRPRVFVVNPRDAEEVSLRAAPRSDSAEVRVRFAVLDQTTRRFPGVCFVCGVIGLVLVLGVCCALRNSSPAECSAGCI